MILIITIGRADDAVRQDADAVPPRPLRPALQAGRPADHLHERHAQDPIQVRPQEVRHDGQGPQHQGHHQGTVNNMRLQGNPRGLARCKSVTKSD